MLDFCSLSFESTPYDGRHPATLDPGDDWRNGTGILGYLDRVTSYGNYAGLGNRNQVERGYHAPIDGIDAAAERHDTGYEAHAGASDPFTTWEGMRAVADDDRRLVADVGNEMAVNGSRYSTDAQDYSKGMRAFFGARAMGSDAVDWAEDKGGEAASGVEHFIDDARTWDDIGDVGTGLAGGAAGAGSWLFGAGSEAVQGVGHAAGTLSDLGPRAMLDAAAGFADFGIVGAGHAASSLWDWVSG